MKLLSSTLLLLVSLGLNASADLIIVQKIEGAGPVAEMTMKIKGGKSRFDMTPQLAMIFDNKTGEMLQLMKDQKTVVRMSGEKMKAMADTMKKYSGQTQTTEKPKVTSTGKKETINGYEAEEYAAENPSFKASYWVAPKYPNAAAILKELQLIDSSVWDPGSLGIPSFKDLPGLPIKTVISVGGTQMTSTLVSIKQESVSDSEFDVPKDFKEVEMPEVGSMPQQDAKQPAASASPQP
jgi:hypothetical protein